MASRRALPFSMTISRATASAFVVISSKVRRRHSRAAAAGSPPTGQRVVGRRDRVSASATVPHHSVAIRVSWFRSLSRRQTVKLELVDPVFLNHRQANIVETPVILRFRPEKNR